MVPSPTPVRPASTPRAQVAHVIARMARTSPVPIFSPAAPT